jgi:hypothetical protein
VIVVFELVLAVVIPMILAMRTLFIETGDRILPRRMIPVKRRALQYRKPVLAAFDIRLFQLGDVRRAYTNHRGSHGVVRLILYNSPPQAY